MVRGAPLVGLDEAGDASIDPIGRVPIETGHALWGSKPDVIPIQQNAIDHVAQQAIGRGESDPAFVGLIVF